MDQDLKLLEELGENAQMGIRTIDQLLTMVEDAPFREQLQRELTFYKDFWEDVRRQLLDRGADEQVFSRWEKMKTDVMLGMGTATDKSTSHIAEMLVLGSTRGVIQLERDLHAYPNAGQEVIRLERHLLAGEEDNILRLRTFL